MLPFSAGCAGTDRPRVISSEKQAVEVAVGELHS